MRFALPATAVAALAFAGQAAAATLILERVNFVMKDGVINKQ